MNPRVLGRKRCSIHKGKPTNRTGGQLRLRQNGFFANKTLGSPQGAKLVQFTKYGGECGNITDISIYFCS